MNKRIFLSLLFGMIVQLMFSTITITYNFDQPKIDENGQYVKVLLEDCYPNGVVGQPEIPYKGDLFYLPQSEEITNINIRLSNPQEIQINKSLYPVQQQYPLSLMEKAEFTKPDESIYGSAKAFPYETSKNIRTDFMAGHSVGSFSFSPVEYYPLDNRIVWYSQATVEIETQVTDRGIQAQNLRKDNLSIYKRLVKSVANPELIPNPNPTRNIGIDYLLIYPEEYLNQIREIEYYHKLRNRNVKLLSIEYIENNPVPNGASYRDLPEKIREYIKYYYSLPVNNIQFVLLAGDSDIIPHRGFYVDNGSQSDYDIPADCYYSNLDRTFDADNNGLFGEQMDADLMPELAIGRICYNDVNELDNIINKLHKFTEEPVLGLVETSLMVGEWLWEGPTWGGDHMDELIGLTNLYGYSTEGFPETWAFQKLYDRDFGYQEAWGPSSLFPLMNQGATYVNHLGHSNTTYNMRIYNQLVTTSNITNNGVTGNYSVHFTQGCYAGSFDNRGTSSGSYGDDSITEKFTGLETSAVAMISHSRYGWGVQGSTNGVSQKFHRQWADAIFTEEIVEIGETLNDCKIDNIPFMDDPTMYWVYYETNLFGDPAMNLWKETPAVIEEDITTVWEQGQSSYSLDVTTPDVTGALVNADNEILWSGEKDILGNINVVTESSLLAGDYRIILNAPYHLPKEIDILVETSEQAFISITSIVNNNLTNIFSANDTISFDLEIENLGTDAFTGDAYIELVCLSDYLEILQDSLSIGSLSGEEVINLNDVFVVKNNGGHEDFEEVELKFISHFGDSQSVTQTNVTLNASHVMLDAVIMANDNLAPQANTENPVNLSLRNNGSGYARNLDLILYSYYTGISISPSSYSISEIAPQDTVMITDIFTININDSYQDYDPGNVVLTIVNPFYTVDEYIYDFIVGQDMFTFETGDEGFATEAPNNAFVNQWHRSNHQNNTPNGSFSYKFGGIGPNHYSNSAYGYLTTPIFNVVANSQFVFSHRMKAEVDNTSPASAWDGGYVEMSVNGGAYHYIEPVGGYPYYLRTNEANAIAGSTPVYSGNMPWSEAVFNLGNTSGTVQFRFVFGSDGATVDEGWYVDDIHLVSPTDNIANDVELASAQIINNYPNPFNPETTISYTIPTNNTKNVEKVKIEIYNIKGQKVKTLVNQYQSPGNYQVVWKGDNDNKQAVASGIYLAKLSVAQKNDYQKMVLIK